MALLGSLAIIAFLAGLVCLVRPIKAIRIPTRPRAAAVMAVSFVVFVVAAAMTDTPPTQPESQTPQRQEPQAATSAAVSDEQSQVPVQPSSAEPRQADDWNVHEFKVVSDEDISSSNRLRRRVTILAPSALTREDRIATLIDAGRKAWQMHQSQFISLFLLPFDSGPTVARIDYAPDKCGVSGQGQDCTDRVWTDAHASDVVFTTEQQQVYAAWETNKDRFKELDEDFGFETVNEERLKAFLAERFDTSTDEIFNTTVQATSAAIQQEVTIPDRLERLGRLDEQEQKQADEKACRASLHCWGDKHSVAASVYCPDSVERLARYDHEWTDGFLGSKFSRFAWKDRKRGTLTYIGDEIKFQNAFGAWQPHTYHCDFDPLQRQVLDVRAMPGRL